MKNVTLLLSLESFRECKMAGMAKAAYKNHPFRSVVTDSAKVYEKWGIKLKNGPHLNLGYEMFSKCLSPVPKLRESKQE